MADMLRTGISWWASQLQGYVSEPITYARGSQSVNGNATYARQLLNVTDRHGHVRVERADRDFAFPISLLTGFSPPIPQRGDTVTLANGEVFVVMPLGVNEPEWRYADHFEQMVRVHSKAQ